MKKSGNKLLLVILVGIVVFLCYSFVETECQEVESVISEGIKYTVCTEGGQSYLRSDNICVEALDIETGKKLWKKNIYDIEGLEYTHSGTDEHGHSVPSMPVIKYITDLSIRDDKLVVMDNYNREYELDTKTGEIISTASPKTKE